jgi:hypothetical protein
LSFTLSAIRAGLTANIQASIADVNMTGYLMTPPEPPCFEIDFPADSFVYDFTAHRGGDELDLIVRGIVSMGDPDAGQKNLDLWLDGAVKTAIESDKTLGGAVEDLRVTQATGHRRVPIDNTVYLCAEWTVHLLLVP